MVGVVTRYRDYENRLLNELMRLLADRDPADPLGRSKFFDDFRLERISFEGTYPDARLVVLFRRPEQSDCIYGAKSLNVWAPQDPQDDWWPLDVKEQRDTVRDVADMIRVRMDSEVWPSEAEPAPPCNPDETGVTWVDWRVASH